MNLLLWVYRRTGQMICFSASALALVSAAAAASDEAASALAYAVMGSALLLAGVALRAIRVWQTIDDPLG